MKKNLLFLPVVLALVSSLTFVGCKDDEDTTPPVVTLNGDPSPDLELQATFTDPGATAVDDEDGNLQVTVEGSVNKNLVGTYVLTYSATDNSGNTGSAQRVVTYENALSSDPFEGTWNCVISQGATVVDTYSEDLDISTTLNNGLEWSKFGNYSNANAKLNIVFTGNNQVSVPQQTIICGQIPVARTFSGNGTTTGSGGSGSSIVLIVTETTNGQSATFTHTYSR